MIKINLALKKQAAYAVPVADQEQTGLSAFLYRFKGQEGSSQGSGDLKKILPKVLIPIAISAAMIFGFDFYTEHKRAEFQSIVQAEEQDIARIKKDLDRLQGFEKLRAELETSEKILKKKIETIEMLMNDREGAFRSLVTLSQSLPREVWMTEFSTTEQGINLRGGTLDLSLITDVMTRLGGSIYFKDVSLKSSSFDQTGRQATFELSAQRGMR